MNGLDDIERAQALVGTAREILTEVALRAPSLVHDVQWQTADAGLLQERLGEWVRLVEIAVTEAETWADSLRMSHARALAEAAVG
ncbi:hypothetical protein ITJ43_09770 [Microbacterium sp. VKM Ac-2870]|uniref:hypothetical protein n=1 Tax=Microbacterium sp. VKM Ac-2870 TaxID=2783825 RepID=UPI00188B7F26|nr:hypothetical protein [Microbacterium sp. VKM Ac-2870]MBF4562429.1 hypothetical protein [Microbacterium sp. VKM Ac-2870]